MATNIPLVGNFRVTCVYKKPGKWIAGWHTGIDLVGENPTIYSSCSGVVTRTGYDNSYGYFVVIRNSADGKFHWFCHLSKILVKPQTKVYRTSRIGIMGNTGNSTGAHLHFEIRNRSNKYADTSDPAAYMGIPNKKGRYNTANYKLSERPVNNPQLKALSRSTYLRNEPTTNSSKKTLYLKNTTVYVLNPSVAQANGYTWDKVRIRVTGKVGYMINKNYK